jgi:hypothetical protein
MTREDILSCMRLCEAMFPKKIITPEAVEAWEMAFLSQSKETLRQAILKHSEHNTYPPTVAQLNKELKSSFTIKGTKKRISIYGHQFEYEVVIRYPDIELEFYFKEQSEAEDFITISKSMSRDWIETKFKEKLNEMQHVFLEDMQKISDPRYNRSWKEQHKTIMRGFY